jgi:hypothetical protein
MPDHASVSATGGLGTNFEQRVQAAFLIGLLTGGPVPCVPEAHLVRLAFQTTKLGYATDDLLAEAQTGTGQTHRLLVQLKNNLTLSDQNPHFDKVLKEFWHDYQARDRFDLAHDRLVLIKSGLNDQERNHVKVALHWARAMATSTEFFLELDRAHDKRKRVEIFRRVLARVSEAPVSDEVLWQFLRCVELLDYDYMTTGSVDEAALLHLLKLAKSERAEVSELDIWREAQSEAARLNTAGGSVELASLVNTSLYQRFAVDRLQPVMRAVRQLADNGRAVMAPLRNTIDDQHLPRATSKAAVLEAIYAQSLVLVSGEAGVGKSAVARDVLAEYFPGVPVFAFRADQFNVPHLSQVFTGLGIHESLPDMLAALALLPEKMLLIDSGEKLLEAGVDGAFQQLLAMQPIGASCKLVLTTRQYAVESLVYRYPLAGAGRVVVPRLSDTELTQLSAGRPTLAVVLQNVHLRELLRSLKYLDLTGTLLRKDPVTDLSAISLPEFKNLVWRRVVEDAAWGTGLAQRRSQAFSAIALQRARQMTLYAAAPAGTDEQALEALVQDGLLLREADAWQFAPTHDVLEDLALTRFIRDQWQATGRPVPFFQAIGHGPALRRGFRLWLTDLLADERTSGEALGLVTQVLTEAPLTAYWHDELLVATFRSAYAGAFFQRFEAELPRDSAALLRRCAHLLRTACRQYAAGGPGDNTRLQPIGSGWGALLQVSARHWPALTAERLLLARVLVEWAPAIGSAGEALPAGAEAAKELTFAILAEAEEGEAFWQEGSAQALLPELIQLAFELTEVAQMEVRALLARALAPTGDELVGWQRRAFYKQVRQLSLSGLRTGQLCKYLSDLVVAIANQRWKITSWPGLRAAFNSQTSYNSRLEREQQFGLRAHQSRYYPAGVYKTPVHQLLTHRPDVGLPFVVNFVGYCTRAYGQYLVVYRREDEDFTAVPLSLADGTVVTQAGNDELWMAYRGTTSAPELLTSVLMGVEHYLLQEAERGVAPDFAPLRTAFRYLLTQATSVALTGVLASVALAYPEEVGVEWLPLLTVRHFFEWDFARAMRERTAHSPVDHQLPVAQQHRAASNYLAHRTRYQKGLLDFVWRYQLQKGQFTAQVHQALDQHWQVISDQTPLRWRQRLSDMDVRGWQVTGIDEIAGLATVEPTYDAAIQAERAAEAPYFAAQSERLTMAGWIETALSGQVGDAPDFTAWENIYVAYTTLGRQPDFLNRLSGLAVVGLRYFAAQLTTAQQQWCCTTLHDSLAFRLDYLYDMGDASSVDERNSFQDQQVVWQSFALLYASAADSVAHQSLEMLLLRTVVTVPAGHQLAYALTHLREEFFVQFPNQLPPIAGRLLAYAQLIRADQVAEASYPLAVREPDDQLTCLQSLLESPAPAWEPTAVTLATHEIGLVARVLALVPYARTEPVAVAYVRHLTQLVLAVLVAPELSDNLYRPFQTAPQPLGFETQELVAQHLGQYLLYAAYEQAEAVMNLLLAAGEMVRPLPFRREEPGVYVFGRKVLRYTVQALIDLMGKPGPLVADRTAHFWRLWAYLRERAVAPASRWLAPLVLLDVDWTAGFRHWPPLESGREEYLRALQQLGDTDLGAGLRVLVTAGSQALLPAALPIVVALLRTHTSLLHLLFAVEAEQLAQRLFQQHLRAIKARPVLLEDLLWLLDSLVVAGSSIAYLLREDVITFKAT